MLLNWAYLDGMKAQDKHTTLWHKRNLWIKGKMHHFNIQYASCRWSHCSLNKINVHFMWWQNCFILSTRTWKQCIWKKNVPIKVTVVLFTSHKLILKWPSSVKAQHKVISQETVLQKSPSFILNLHLQNVTSHS